MPDILAAIKKVRGEQPDQADTSIEPAGFFGRLLGGKADASASPWTGAVTYNEPNMDKLSQPQAENVIAHELTHSRQIQNTPYLGRLANVVKSMIPGLDESYYQRPREMEAYQTERDRNMRLGQNLPDPASGATDIQLPPPSSRRKMMAMFTNDRGKPPAAGQ